MRWMHGKQSSFYETKEMSKQEIGRYGICMHAHMYSLIGRRSITFGALGISCGNGLFQGCLGRGDSIVTALGSMIVFAAIVAIDDDGRGSSGGFQQDGCIAGRIDFDGFPIGRGGRTLQIFLWQLLHQLNAPGFTFRWIGDGEQKCNENQGNGGRYGSFGGT